MVTGEGGGEEFTQRLSVGWVDAVSVDWLDAVSVD